MNRTTTFIAGALAGAALTVAVAFTVQSSPPKSLYESIPLPPPLAYRTLGEANASLVQAIEKAERESEGRAYSAMYDLAAEPPTVTVMVYTESEMHRFVIDGEACEIDSKSVVQPFPGEPVQGEWSQTPSGVFYFDLVEGDGAQPEGPSSHVSVHYSGWMIDGRMFDSSVQRGVPTSFQLGGVIAGWREGVSTMRVGGKRKLIIPGHLAYGPAGNPRAGIPPNATLVFDVELLEVREGAEQPPQPPQSPRPRGH